jgi:carbamoyl-phosphate synthase large subunit
MPYIFTRIAYGEQAPELSTKLNPVEPGLVWIRGMDFEPVLTSRKAIEENVESLNELVKRLHR